MNNPGCPKSLFSSNDMIIVDTQQRGYDGHVIEDHSQSEVMSKPRWTGCYLGAESSACLHRDGGKWKSGPNNSSNYKAFNHKESCESGQVGDAKHKQL